MMWWQDWYSVARVLVTGIVGYAALVVVLRISGKRTLSKMNAFDLVVTVALGSSLATVILSRQVPIVDGVVAFVLLVGLQFVVTWASVRSAWVGRIVKSQPALLYYRGQLLEDALCRERVTVGEVRAAVREQGFASLEEIEAVVLETAGELSVIPRRPDGATDALPNGTSNALVDVN